ncbi:MAG TPA: ornithine cyclodeaminase [Anaerolineae bacterium]|nr:ornithine cyclodeaminase [Anaerolineae bacterium]
MSFHILTAADVRAALPMPAAIDAMRKAFSLLSAGEADMPLRTMLQIPKHAGRVLVMPAYLHIGNRLGAKILSAFPNNPDLELPAIHALVVLINAATGQPEALLEGTALTAIRTGAASGLATDLLSRPDAATLALIGSGAQARTQLEAVCCVRRIECVRVYSPHRAHAERFAQELAGRNGAPAAIDVVASAREAIREADIICTATSSATPVIGPADVRPGTHINGIGSYTPDMREVDPELVKQSRVIVDQRQAALAEAGEVIACIANGALQESQLIELGEVVNGVRPGRTHPEQITFFKSVGLAAQDIAAAQQALTAALHKKIGVSVNL